MGKEKEENVLMEMITLTVRDKVVKLVNMTYSKEAKKVAKN